MEIILCNYAGDNERRKLRTDFGITYDADALKMIDKLKEWGIEGRDKVIQPMLTLLSVMWVIGRMNLWKLKSPWLLSLDQALVGENWPKGGGKSRTGQIRDFSLWNLPLMHPVNLAYEAATADIGGFNLIDPFPFEAYGVIAINYNRDVEIFPVVKRILEKITGSKSIYKSTTDMGVNCVSQGIIDEEIFKEADRQELIRRYLRYAYE